MSNVKYSKHVSNCVGSCNFRNVRKHSLPVTRNIGVTGHSLAIVTSNNSKSKFTVNVNRAVRTVHHGIGVACVIVSGRVCNLAGKRASPHSTTNFGAGSAPRNSVRRTVSPVRVTLATNTAFITRDFSASLGSLATLVRTNVGRSNFSLVGIFDPYIACGGMGACS